MAAVPTIEIGDTQVQESQGQETMWYPDSQVQMDATAAEGLGGEQGAPTLNPNWDPTWTDAQPRESQETPEQVHDDAVSQGPAAEQPPAEQNVPMEVTPASGALVRSNAADELAEPAETEEPETFVFCRRCGIEVLITETIVRGPKECWCRACNSLYVMLKRNMKWPPAEFSALDEGAQSRFWRECAEDKGSSTKFSYSSVRDIFKRCIVEETVMLRKVEVGGTYLPISVYKKRGYNIDAKFEERNPCQWSDGLQDWTYLLSECSVSEAEVQQTIEKVVLEAERVVRKRKADDAALGDKEQEAIEAKSSATAIDCEPLVMDLLSEDEAGDAGARYFPQ